MGWAGAGLTWVGMGAEMGRDGMQGAVRNGWWVGRQERHRVGPAYYDPTYYDPTYYEEGVGRQERHRVGADRAYIGRVL